MQILHRSRPWALGLALGGLALFSGPTHAQETTSPLRAGSWVRLTAPSAGLRYSSNGVVDSASSRMLFVSQRSERRALGGVSQLAVPVSAITRLDVRSGQRSRSSAIGAGALIGLAVGTLVPIALAAGTDSVNEPDSWGWGGVALGIAAIVPWTSGIGAAIGAILPVDRWQRVIPASN